jgi:hypothetical protein
MNFIINLYLRGVIVELSWCRTFVQPSLNFFLASSLRLFEIIVIRTGSDRKSKENQNRSPPTSSVQLGVQSTRIDRLNWWSFLAGNGWKPGIENCLLEKLRLMENHIPQNNESVKTHEWSLVFSVDWTLLNICLIFLADDRISTATTRQQSTVYWSKYVSKIVGHSGGTCALSSYLGVLLSIRQQCFFSHKKSANSILNHNLDLVCTIAAYRYLFDLTWDDGIIHAYMLACFMMHF